MTLAVRAVMTQVQTSSELTDCACAPAAPADPPSPAKAEFLVEAAGMTDIGQARDRNEDSFLIATLQRSLVIHHTSPGTDGWFSGEPAGTLLIVADGMGGQGGGDVASSVAVSTVANHLLNVMPWVPGHTPPARTSQVGLRSELAEAVLVGDEGVRAQAAQTMAPQMGTTLTLGLIIPPFLYIAHVGDTRCYLLEGGQLQCLTTDHNLAQRYVDESPNPVEPPARLQHILWNALGAGIDEPVPDVCKYLISAGAVVLVCSDGLNKHVSDDEIAEILGSGGSCASRAARLIERANAGGGTDNITALVADALARTDVSH